LEFLPQRHVELVVYGFCWFADKSCSVHFQLSWLYPFLLNRDNSEEFIMSWCSDVHSSATLHEATRAANPGTLVPASLPSWRLQHFERGKEFNFCAWAHVKIVWAKWKRVCCACGWHNNGLCECCSLRIKGHSSLWWMPNLLRLVQ
jgi:hypothetical protein